MAPELAGRMATKAVAAVKPATRAYVTFLAGDGDYWKGVVGLAKGLRKVGSAYPLVVAVLPDVSESRRRILISQGCIVREIEPVYPRENQTQFAMAYYVINYSKLRIWEFVEYERMVYLDADIQVFENIDELFELEKGHFYAVMDCFCDKTWSHTPQYKIGYCQQCPDKVAWPTAELGPPPSLYFNAGMFVHEPSMATAKALLDTLRVTAPTPFAEQDFLNMFFREQYKPIPLVYNLVLAMLEKVKVMHYCAAVFADNATTGTKTGSSLVQAVGRNKMAGALLAEQVRRCLPVLGIVATSTAATALATGTTTTPATGFALLVLLLGGLSLVTLGVLMDRGANGRGCDGDDVSLS